MRVSVPILKKRNRRWASSEFAQNFIRSTKFQSFFKAYGRSVLSNLKHLRLCDLSLDLENRQAFSRTLSSFGELEELDIIRAKCVRAKTFKLSLPMLTSIHLEDLRGIEKITLDARRLRNVKVLDCTYAPYYDLVRLNIVNGESVESFMTSINPENATLRGLKNLKYLYASYLNKVSNHLFEMEQLKEIHLSSSYLVTDLFEQKRRYGRDDLKIYVHGLLWNGPNDPARLIPLQQSVYGPLSAEMFAFLAVNTSRLADVIPFYRCLDYSSITRVAPGLEMDVLKRFTGLNEILVDWWVRHPVPDIQRFLNLLSNFENITSLEFRIPSYLPQPQDLFDRLPEHSAIQSLTIYSAPPDLAFLFRMKQLNYLKVRWSADAELVRNVFKELPLLYSFTFDVLYTDTTIERVPPKHFKVFFGGTCKRKPFPTVNAAIKYIFRIKTTSSKKRKADDMEASVPPAV